MLQRIATGTKVSHQLIQLRTHEAFRYTDAANRIDSTLWVGRGARTGGIVKDMTALGDCRHPATIPRAIPKSFRRDFLRLTIPIVTIDGLRMTFTTENLDRNRLPDVGQTSACAVERRLRPRSECYFASSQQ